MAISRSPVRGTSVVGKPLSHSSRATQQVSEEHPESIRGCCPQLAGKSFKVRVGAAADTSRLGSLRSPEPSASAPILLNMTEQFPPDRKDSALNRRLELGAQRRLTPQQAGERGDRSKSGGADVMLHAFDIVVDDPFA